MILYAQTFQDINTFNMNYIDNNLIEDKCKKYGIKNYSIRDNGLVDVNGDVYKSNNRTRQS